ncbi:MAG: DNA polymerase III subunit beta [Clostridia bacterium]|nr:DNA polymerase III subunit beta [Clostridia bacterium]
MKFTVSKSILMDYLSLAMGTVSNKNTITSLEGVLLETMEDGRIRLSTYDMNKGIRCLFMPSEIERDGKFIINANRFYQTVRVLPDGEITIDINDKLNCNIYCGKASFSMFAMRGEDFPNLPELETEKGFLIKSDILAKMISKVSHSICDMDTRPNLKGAYFKITNSSIEVVSCDGYILSKCNMACDIEYIGNTTGELSFIIPGHALPEIVKIIDSGEENVKFYLSRKHAIIRNGDIVFFTRIIDMDYIEYNRMIPNDNNISVRIDRERILSGLERANIVADEKIQGSGKSYVKLAVDGDVLTISSSSVNGRFYDEIDCFHEGNSIEICFNCRYLINTIKVAEGENILISMQRYDKAIIIKPAEEGNEFNYIYMILPLKIKDEN